jgi:hypothetical protein
MQMNNGMTNQRNQFKSGNQSHWGQRPGKPAVRACRAAVNGMGKQFLAELAGEYKSSLPGQWLERAFADAEAVAWSTPYPLLFLPELAREKVHNVRRWAERQQQILQATPAYAVSPAN